MGLTISISPGFSDLSDSILAANQPALGLDIGKIYVNSVFGMVRPEVFVTGPYQNGDTVALPVSAIDGYAYSRNELIYLWVPQNSVDKSSGWITGADSLWFLEYGVDQTTGLVTCNEWYRRSGSHYDGVHTNDGTLTVFTIAQRQQSTLTMAAAASYAGITAGWIAQDKPLTQQLAQGLNDDAKFGVVNKEAFYLGEYYNGQTVAMPTSPIDGHVYSSSECKFGFAWRWTTTGNATKVTQPLLSKGQLGPITASVNSSGVVSTAIKYIDDNGNLNSFTADGRIAVFAFCQRSGTPGSITPAAVNFAEISFDNFMPGEFLSDDTDVQQIVNNILESLLAVEYFGPTTHQDGDTIPIPTSSIDGHVYLRSDLTYIWQFTDTSNASGSNLRMESFGGDINQTTGLVSLYGFRLPPGGPQNTPATVSFNRISVITVARRNAHAQTTVGSSGATLPGSSGVGGNQVVDVPTVSAIAIVPAIGTINSSNQAFTLASSATIIAVLWNGQFRTDFTQSSPPSTSFSTSFTPDTNDTLTALVYT